ncbi:30S ribosomal protein S16 [bacterium]|nr:30S ribosomal protein S16 [bacterium]MBT5942276.1 30S ribosomal protein S16 [bacterium]MBT6335266.1 30S ribosomal protein S16 [bacterium]MBT7336261.1 30S ribosomal protein S16 [bacterium]
MLMIRLSRVGKKKQPTYRIIISEKQKDPWGKYLELLGNYNPHTKEINLEVDRIKYWLSKGAQASNTVNNLLIKEGILEGDKKKSVAISKKLIARKESKDKEADDKKQAEEVKKEEPKTETPKEEAKVEEKPKEEKAEEAPKEEVKKEEPKA